MKEDRQVKASPLLFLPSLLAEMLNCKWLERSVTSRNKELRERLAGKEPLNQGVLPRAEMEGAVGVTQAARALEGQPLAASRGN